MVFYLRNLSSQFPPFSFRFFISICLVITAILSAFSQENLAIGQWRSHLPYKQGKFVTQSKEKVYFATTWSILSLDKAEFSVEFLSKVEGLSNVGIQMIKYNQRSDILIVVYENSVIDLVRPNPFHVSTMNQIANYDNFVGEKIIYDIFVENDSMVYLATNYGISKINILAEEFVFTTFTGVAVKGVLVFDDYILAATEEGIYRINKEHNIPDDFGNWSLYQTEGLPNDYSSAALTTYEGDLYFDVNDTLFQEKEGMVSPFHFEDGYSVKYLTAEGENLLAGFSCKSGCNGKMLYFSVDESPLTAAPGCVDRPISAVEDEWGRTWFADKYRNFRLLNKPTDDQCLHLAYNSPHTHNTKEIAVFENEVWIATGGVTEQLGHLFRDDGFFSFIDGEWDTYNKFTRDELLGENPSDATDDVREFLTIAVHPQTKAVYVGSFLEGLVEFDRENIRVFDEQNSSLGFAVGDVNRVRVSGLAFDEENNLWIGNHLSEAPFSVYKNDGSWKSFRPPACNDTELLQVVIDQNNYKWFVVGSDRAGVMVYDHGQDIEDTGDDRCRLFRESNSNIPTNRVNCLAVDLDGDVWAGTNEGIVIFECGSSAFETDICQGSLRIVEQDGFGAHLLETEEILSLAVDGANRKWIGTKNGIFVLSPSGEEQIARFTAQNSPLFDNNVIDLAINPKNGEVFIGTNKGLLSYRTDAIEGGFVHSPSAKVFPNPVRPEYNGPIVIKGLARDADVKITDINGQLIYETKALGGQAIWNGQDYNGRRASSGVYLVFGTTNSRHSNFGNPDTVVAKILFIN
ncbi:MAG: hypothetical protein GY705_24410 [Bacteroidetes bacterium]|nr:hypothetical protein [Bacteroidota bacterium]